MTATVRLVPPRARARARLCVHATALAGALLSTLTACDKLRGAATIDSAAADSAAAAGDTSATPRTAMALPVAVTAVRDGDLVLSVTTTGQVRSDGEALLKAEVAGTVEKVLVHPGDRVRRGAPLVTLDPRPFDLAVAEAQAAVDEAQVRYYDAVAPDSIVLGRPPSDDQRRIALTRSGLQTARVRLDRARLDRERATITAPYDGMVDRVDVSQGERVAAGGNITRVVNLNALRIEANVLEHDLPLIKEGGNALITSAAAPDEQVTGRISAVLPVIDSTTRSGRAYVRLAGGGKLRPGMYADVRLEASRLTNRRLVPARAVIERDGRPLVFVVKDGRAQWVYILPGRTNGIETEVLPDSSSGLIPVEVGDNVIVEGHLTLTHDAPVRVVQAEEPKKKTVGRAKSE
ncbi:MAG TPA: efflux RND transporter periplasmic adaptor subunit [Gemmatimonadaceae bacterium]|nr:efflux RND transporter periplasmic adaptor subunit [Gemmatimonadaceae bacterium]